MLLLPIILAALIPSADGLTIHDTTMHVTWLANADLAATQRFGISGIASNGAMKYATALQYLAALNASNYLGHNNWQLPASLSIDTTCGATGPNGSSFGADCMGSAMPSLYYKALGLQFPDTAVPIPGQTTGPFTNFQPYLYWSDTENPNSKTGFRVLSFNTGWEGSNVDNHSMYALPMIKGRLPGSPPPNGTGLQVSADGQTVYDPVADVTWLANANLAKTQQFTAQCTNRDGTHCISADGSMSHTAAEAWIAAMNTAHYLGQSNWQLPPITDGDTCPGFNCTTNPMGNLYYTQLKLQAGTPAVATPSIKVGPFTNLQPYLYWSCQAAPGSNVLCTSDAPAPNFAWSFSFGNGFQGTDLQINELYVMLYFPDPPPKHRSVRH